MILLGLAFVFNMDVIGILTVIPDWLRIVGGVLYVVCASFMVHYAISYRIVRKDINLVCQHCGHEITEDTKNGE
tara:strand:- start:32 stop:253 length:222 start_codon:yes stop_codon:yes gene_type:complete